MLAAEPEARQWGIGGDNNAYPGMHEDSARACAACAAAAGAVAQGAPARRWSPPPAPTTGTASQAQGFGIYNETAVAVRALLDAGLERVAYVDLDVHHGNGTQWIFYDEPRVLTVSVHESGRHLFPGSGFPAETGGAGAPGIGRQRGPAALRRRRRLPRRLGPGGRAGRARVRARRDRRPVRR